jgi:protein-S-isoprenylcysteine O-methyltransferase Ste14
VTALVRRVVQLMVMMAIQAVVLFASAGTLAWPAAWLYLALYVGSMIMAAAVIVPGHREVVEERGKGLAGAVSWDRYLATAQMFPLLGILVVAGLAQRWGWEPRFPAWLVLVGAVLFIAGYAVALWAMAANRFFSQVVRIQTDRGHTVVTDGPYRVVRHPGYTGFIVSALGSALLLGSVWALLPWAAYLAVMVARTSLEDSTLARELSGYGEYRTSTRYRLVPHIW